MAKFKIEFKDKDGDKYPGNIVVGYDNRDSNLLQTMEVNMQGITAEQLAWFVKSFLEMDLDLFIQKSARTMQVEVTPIAEDLSFERFWQEYKYKVGSKDRARRLWEALEDTEKSDALHAIKPYRYWLSHQNNTNTCLPQTYLKQRRWENEFKV